MTTLSSPRLHDLLQRTDIIIILRPHSLRAVATPGKSPSGTNILNAGSGAGYVWTLAMDNIQTQALDFGSASAP